MDDGCPAPEGAPTLRGELKRGVNPYNLKVGAAAALLIGAGAGALTARGDLPDGGWGPWGQGLAVVAGLFVLLTLIHTVAHASMGWIFERGLALHCRGHFAAAARWLAMAERPGMDHYDPHGVALEALRDCRSRLSSD